MRDLEVAFFNANLILPDLMTHVAKIYQIIGLYISAVLNTHNLDMILQLKYLTIVHRSGGKYPPLSPTLR